MKTPDEIERQVELIFGQVTAGSMGGHLLQMIYEDMGNFSEGYATKFINAGEAWMLLGQALIPEASRKDLNVIRYDLLTSYDLYYKAQKQREADEAKERSWYEHEFDETQSEMIQRDVNDIIREQQERDDEHDGHPGDPSEYGDR
jgi:hypothetical protein